MKRKIFVLVLLIALIATGASCVFAESSELEIVKTSPADGDSGFQPANMAVKITFSEDMVADESIIDSNKSKFHIYAQDGSELEFDIVYNSKKYPDELWLVITATLESNSPYRVVIDEGVRSSSGATLARGMELTFRTRNTSLDQKISMGMMIGMMGLMFYMTTKAAKKSAEKADPKSVEKVGDDKLNPYKISKEKNISLDKAQAIVERRKAKIDKKMSKIEEARQKREAQKAAYAAQIADELVELERKALREEGIYRVSRPHSMKSVTGSTPRIVERRKAAKRKSASRSSRRRR
ncbi:MAG: Ig-like domain-containing protein [Clostridiales bacterium]|nr:Ig-like domain-containing protein [Clostridiales bacterium]